MKSYIGLYRPLTGQPDDGQSN